MASTLVGLPQFQNVMDHRWLGTVLHLQTWRAQHIGVIKRVSFAGHTAQREQENLIPPRMHARSGRTLNKTYQPSQSMPRMYSACGMSGHFMTNCLKPNIIELSQAKGQKTIKAANAQRLTLESI